MKRLSPIQPFAMRSILILLLAATILLFGTTSANAKSNSRPVNQIVPAQQPLLPIYDPVQDHQLTLNQQHWLNQVQPVQTNPQQVFSRSYQTQFTPQSWMYQWPATSAIAAANRRRPPFVEAMPRQEYERYLPPVNQEITIPVPEQPGAGDWSPYQFGPIYPTPMADRILDGINLANDWGAIKNQRLLSALNGFKVMYPLIPPVTDFATRAATGGPLWVEGDLEAWTQGGLLATWAYVSPFTGLGGLALSYWIARGAPVATERILQDPLSALAAAAIPGASHVNALRYFSDDLAFSGNEFLTGMQATSAVLVAAGNTEATVRTLSPSTCHQGFFFWPT